MVQFMGRNSADIITITHERVIPVQDSWAEPLEQEQERSIFWFGFNCGWW
jgi:hypothetical protein